MELYVGFASFVYYIKKKGYEFKKQGKNTLSFNYSGGRYYSSKIMPGKNGVDCGYIVLNKNDVEILFGNNDEYLSDEYVKNIFICERPKQNRPDGSREHCHLPEPLWGRIETEIRQGESVNCGKNPV